VLLRIAWRNLGRGWRRSTLVLSTIALGLAACILVLSWSKGMFQQMVDTPVQLYLGHVAIQAEGYFDDPDVARNLGSQGPRLLELASAEAGGRASARLGTGGLVQTARKNLRATIIGVDPEREARVSIVPASILSGDFLAEPAQGRALPGAVIGAQMAELLDAELGDKLVLRVAGEAGLGAFRVRGIFRSGTGAFDRDIVYVRLDRAQTLMGVDAVTEIALFLDDPEAMVEHQESLRAAVNSEFGSGRFAVLNWKERQPRLAYMIEMAGNLSWILYVVIYVAMAFGIANAMLMSVYERMREFGVLRSIGLRGSRVVWMVLLEAVFLTGLGSLIAVSIAYPLVLWLGARGIDLSAWAQGMEMMGTAAVVYPAIALSDLWTPIWLGSITALLSGIWPAMKAAKVRPAEALRRI
jgi:ABC-type lipoprotein release transport system permease subunit